MFTAPLSMLLEAQPPDSKIASRTLYKVPQRHLSTPLAPQFPGFHPFFKNF